MLGKTFGVMMLCSFVCAVVNGRLSLMSSAVAESFFEAVELCISLCGMMCFWCGLMNVLKVAGLQKRITKLLKPLIKLVYGKRIAKSEECVENVAMSVSANFLGLGNAALPLGIKAVKSLSKLDEHKQTANHETIMFCVLNTVPFQLVPTTLIALRAKHQSANPFDVVGAIWLCSVMITVFAVIVCKVVKKLSIKKGNRT